MKHMESKSKLIGRHVGNVIVKAKVYTLKSNDRFLCVCDCGNERILTGSVLRSNYNVSCGCIKRTADGDRKKQTRLYGIWAGMLSRCNNPNREKYKNYGGRGIKVLFENYKQFKQWAIPNGYKDTLTIERINVNGNYEPSNCTWIPPEEQWKNRTRGGLHN